MFKTVGMVILGGDSTVKEWSTNTGEEISSVNFGNRPIKKLIISERVRCVKSCFVSIA